MKKFKILALALLAGAITFTSCKKDEETPTGPTLSVTTTASQIWYGETVEFSYSITSNEKIKTLTASSDNANVTTDQGETTSFNGDHSASGTISFLAAGSGFSTDGSVTFTFTAEDKDGSAYAITKTVSLSTMPLNTETVLTEEITSGIIHNLIGTGQGAWDLVTNAGVSASGDDADKDMANTTTISSTAPETFDNDWEALNATMFVQDNAFDYATATEEGAMAAYDAGTASAMAMDVQMGDVFIAKLRGGDDYAVIMITHVEITTGDNDDHIMFKYKK